MSVGVQIQINDTGVLAALNRLMLEGSEKRDLLDMIGIGEAENTRMRFIDQEGPDGTPWKPSLRVIRDGGETLRDTGRLMNSVTHRVGSDHVEVGTNVSYAAVMHAGATIHATGGGYLKFRVGGAWVQKRSVTIPARPILGLSPEGEQEVISLIDHFLQTRLQ